MNKLNKLEYGRSMVEMLGVLAVIGVLSVAGIAGYKNAMNKYRANELLNEASKRAVVVATRALSGQQNVSLGEFSGHSSVAGGTFADDEAVDVSGNTFAIKIKNVDEDVCQQMKNTIGSSTVVRDIPENCGAGTISLVFNKDLSTLEDTPNSNDENTGEETGEGTPLTCSGTEPACHTCEQGSYVPDSNLNGQGCKTDPSKTENDGTCNDGVCEEIEPTVEPDACTPECVTGQECVGGICVCPNNQIWNETSEQCETNLCLNATYNQCKKCDPQTGIISTDDSKHNSPCDFNGKNDGVCAWGSCYKHCTDFIKNSDCVTGDWCYGLDFDQENGGVCLTAYEDVLIQLTNHIYKTEGMIYWDAYSLCVALGLKPLTFPLSQEFLDDGGYCDENEEYIGNYDPNECAYYEWDFDSEIMDEVGSIDMDDDLFTGYYLSKNEVFKLKTNFEFEKSSPISAFDGGLLCVKEE